MSDITIQYKGSTIAEMSAAGTKTLNTSGKYCEDNITVSYTGGGGAASEVNYKEYDLTISKASGWVLLTTLDDDVLAHINDASLRVSLYLVDAYEQVSYRMTYASVSNGVLGMQNSYPVYGNSIRNTSQTIIQSNFAYYPANKTDTSTSLGGFQFRLNGTKYYMRPVDGYLGAGNYRLIFTW